MPPLSVLIRLALALVLGVAGVAKLADRPGTRLAVGQFGVPSRFTGAVAVALPIVELATAFGLLLDASAAWGALVACCLLTIFALAIALSLARGRRPECHCFGNVRSAPIGRGALLRNLGLAAIAGVVAVQGVSGSPAPLTGWLDALDRAGRVGVLIGSAAVAVIALQAWFSFALLRQNGALLLRLDALEERVEAVPPVGSRPGLDVGEQAPDFAATTADGQPATLQSILRAARPTLLTFLDPECAPCRELLPELAQSQRAYEERVTIAVVTSGGPVAAGAMRDRYGLRLVLAQRDRDVAEAYRAYGTPAAVAISADGHIARPLALGATRVRELLDEATATDTAPARNGTLAASAAAAAAGAILAAPPASAAAASDPEVQQLRDVLDRGSPALTTSLNASQRTLDKLVTNRPLSGPTRRARTRAGRDALNRNHDALAALRAQVAALTLTGQVGVPAQQIVLEALDLLLQFEVALERSLTAQRSSDRVKYADQASAIFSQAMQRNRDAGYVLGV